MTGKEFIKFIQDNKLEDQNIKIQDFHLETKPTNLIFVRRSSDYVVIGTKEREYTLKQGLELPYEDVTMNLRHLEYEMDNLSRPEIKKLISDIEEISHGHIDIPNFQDYDRDEVQQLMKENNIIFEHGVVGIEYQLNKFGEGGHSVRLLIEDDGNLFRSDFEVAAFWLDDIIKVAQKAKEVINGKAK